MKYLLVGSLEGQPLKWTLDRGIYGLGRAKSNDIRLGDPSISREHAKITIEEHRVILEDLGSRNGTWVNGQRLERAIEVRPGDVFQFGSVRLHLQTEEGPRLDETTLTPELSEPGQIHTSSSLEWAEAKAELDTGSKVSQTLFQIMSEASNLLIVPRDLHDLLDTMLALVERLIPAGRILLLLREDETSDPVVKAARPQSDAGERIMLSRTLINTVIENRRSLLVTDAQSDPRFRDHQSIIALNLRSAIAAPLFDNEKVIGLIYADTTTPGVFYDKDLLRAFTLLSNIIAVKITNSMLLAEQAEKQRYELEMKAAAKMQQSLLPASLPEEPGYQMVAHQLPSRETAGDLYDAHRLADGSLTVVLGDVSGKGVGAAMLMSHVTACYRLLFDICPDLAELAERLNKRVFVSSDMMSFVTLFLGKVDPKTHKFQYVSAGHNPAILLCPEEESTELPATGLPIGLMENATYEVQEVELRPGSLFCVYSDGITEAQVEDEFYGEERLLEALKKRSEEPLQDVVSGLIDDLNGFLGDYEADDDITLFLLRRDR